MKFITKEVKVVNLSLGNLVRKITHTVKKYVKIGFKWLHKKFTQFTEWGHKKLTEFEDWTLNKITILGEKAANKLEVRLNGKLLDEITDELII